MTDAERPIQPPEIDPDTGEQVSDRKVLVGLLNRAADLLDVLGDENGFRANAYRAAARGLESVDTPVAELATLRFKGVPKVGASIAAELVNYLRNGEFVPLAQAAAQLPPGVVELFRVRGLGPKKIRALWGAGIDSPQALHAAAQDGRLAAVKGFGAKSAATLGEAAAFALEAGKRAMTNVAQALGAQVQGWLEAAPELSEPRFSGELRRGADTVGTLRLTVTGTAEAVLAALEGHTDELEAPPGKPLVTGRLGALPLEVGFAAARARGALDLTFGGGPAYRLALRARATELGLHLSGYGLRPADQDGPGRELLPTPQETDVLAALGWPELPPEYRDAEQLEYGAERLPAESELIRLSDIRGMLHTHSTWSDGAESVERMAAEVVRLGHSYLGTADHSTAAAYAGGLNHLRLREQLKEVRELQRAGVPLVAGSEVDILEDGSLDYPDELLSELDYVVASVHSYFTLDRERQTERLVRAASHPLITVLGHPTGRVLLRRPPYPHDLDAVLAACEANGTVVEINASPYRLDLDWRDALRWRERLRFAINTDAHTLGGLRDARYGVQVARKAGLTPAHVINTLGRDEFLAFVAAQRAARR